MNRLLAAYAVGVYAFLHVPLLVLAAVLSPVLALVRWGGKMELE